MEDSERKELNALIEIIKNDRIVKPFYFHTMPLPKLEDFLISELEFNKLKHYTDKYERKRNISLRKYIFNQNVHIFLRWSKKRSMTIHSDITVKGKHKTTELSYRTSEWLVSKLEKFKW